MTKLECKLCACKIAHKKTKYKLKRLHIEYERLRLRYHWLRFNETATFARRDVNGKALHPGRSY